MEKNKKKKIALSVAIVFLSLIFLTSFTSCMLTGGSRTATSTTAAASTQTYTVKKGNVIKSISSSGSVDTSETMNYSLQVSGKVLQVLKAGATFKKGDVLLELDNSDGLTAVKQKELDLKNNEDSLALAKNSITMAKLDYQKALDANHIAIQLADLNAQKAQESTDSA